MKAAQVQGLAKKTMVSSGSTKLGWLLFTLSVALVHRKKTFPNSNQVFPRFLPPMISVTTFTSASIANGLVR